MELDKLVAWLDRTLRVGEYRDVSHNGLQVANSGRATRICTGVDASLPFFEAAVAQGADCVLVHHGLSWGDSLARITGMNYDLVSFAIRHDLAVYACHLPLDAHPTLGNNVLLAKALGVTRCEPFYDYHGTTIGVRGTLTRPCGFDALCERARRQVNPALTALAYGPAKVRTVGIVSGGAADGVGQAATAGLDVYFTGEGSLVGHNLAQHHGVNTVFAGHYATERFGVRALGEAVAREFGLPAAFVDLAIPF